MTINRNGLLSADLDVPVVLPTLNLDFANSQELDPRITFSRGSIGTFVNKNGLIETAAANIPRFDYDPISGECRGLLIEESRSNYFWGTQTGNGGSVTDGTVTGADGVTAKKFVPTLGNTSFPSIYSFTPYTFSVANGGTVDISFSGYFAAIADGLYVPDIVVEFNTGGTTNRIYAELIPDLTNGTVWFKGGIGANGVTELIAPQITLMPFGMYKVTWGIRYTQGATIRDRVHFYIQCRRKGSTLGSNTGIYYADGVNGFQYSCIQYEIGAFPTSYIPTSASTVTRSADLASMTGTNFSSWYNQTEGTLYASINNITTRSSISYDAFVSLTGTDVNRNVMRIYTQTASGGGLQNKFLSAVAYSPDGSYVFNSFDSNVGGPDRIGKTILSYKKDNFAFTVNGLTPTRDVSGDIPTCNQLLIFGASRFQTAPSGTISRLTYYPRALKPNQLQYLTQ